MSHCAWKSFSYILVIKIHILFIFFVVSTVRELYDILQNIFNENSILGPFLSKTTSMILLDNFAN